MTTVPSSVPGRLLARSEVLRARTATVPLIAGDGEPVALTIVAKIVKLFWPAQRGSGEGQEWVQVGINVSRSTLTQDQRRAQTLRCIAANWLVAKRHKAGACSADGMRPQGCVLQARGDWHFSATLASAGRWGRNALP